MVRSGRQSNEISTKRCMGGFGVQGSAMREENSRTKLVNLEITSSPAHPSTRSTVFSASLCLCGSDYRVNYRRRIRRFPAGRDPAVFQYELCPRHVAELFPATAKLHAGRFELGLEDFFEAGSQ